MHCGRQGQMGVDMEGPGFILVFVLIRGIMGAISAAIASSKGRSTAGWFFGGFFLDLLGIIIVACLPNLKEEQSHRDHQNRENRRLREQLRQERLKVEAFQQHTMTRLDAHDNHLGVDTRQTYTALPAYETQPAPQLEGPAVAHGEELLEPASQFNPQPVQPAQAAPAAGGGGSTRQWHYERDGQSFGPIAEAVLLQMLRTGQINGQTLVWTQELGDWRAAGQVRAFKPYMQPGRA